ncbi:type 4b pilus protein PilO2 [Pseudomonas fluorescens]|uniref:type 4b pilus protein PilO2 n=1 Tax=Pseudomonas fluorescens TaxID=294 RepID=UPI001930C083|nr:type 4b pilus protein PilO2 [Pseudomonas fluorescens]MBD8089224.1 type 4b pilus protein PilO2 [Pseudomonas fluorescens]
MERIFDIGGKRLVTSLEWIKLQGKDAALAAKTQAKQRGSKLGTLRTVAIEDGPAVSQVGVCHSKKPKGTFYSAAAHLANIHSSIIAIEQLEDDQFWFCVISEGRVVPGYDVVTTALEIRSMFHELSTSIPLEYMKMLMTSLVAMELNLDEEGLDNLINQSPVDAMTESAVSENARIKNLVGIPNTVYLGLLLVLLVGSFGGFMKYQEIQKQRELEALMAQEAMDLNKIEKEVTVEKVIDQGPTDDELLRRARQQEIEWLRDDFNTINTMPAFKHFYFMSKELPRYKAGWKLNKVSFVAENPKSITAQWTREKYGTPYSIRESFGPEVSVSFTPEMGVSRTAHKITLGSRGVEDILGYIRTQGQSHQVFVTDLMNNGIHFTAGVKAETQRKEVIAGLKNKAYETMPQLSMRVREFQMSGTTYDSFVTLMDVAQRANNFVPKTIDLERLDNGISWKVSGSLYEN